MTVSDVREFQIDALFADDVDRDGPGAAVGIYRRGELILAQGYGLADLESELPITPQTSFHVASVSKQFTAFAIALLARDGKVNLDTDIRDYLPYVPDFGEKITVRHLILHTSGIRNQIMLLLLSGQGVEGRVTQQQIVNMVARQEVLNFPPGTDYSYSNTGYVLLAEVVFAVTGQTLREFTTERIFVPLGMQRTCFIDDVTELVPHRAHSYTRRCSEKGGETTGWARALLNYDNVGSSGLSTTVEDLAKWSGNFINPVVGDEHLVNQITAGGFLDDGTSLNYGFGLERGKINGRPVLSHTGSDAAFRSIFAYFPKHDFSVAILANSELSLMSKVEAIADLYLPTATEASDVTPEEDTRIDLSRFAGTYLAEHDISCVLEVCGGELFHRIGSREPQRLTARIDGTLDFGSPRGRSLIPLVDAAGQVTGMKVPRAGFGRPLLLQRCVAVEFAVYELVEYRGEYRSPELDITYSIDVEEDGLAMTHIWSDRPVVVSPVFPDRFESAGDRTDLQLRRVVVFQRDGEGQINGFLMHVAGERNVRFDRVGDARPALPVASTQAHGVWG